MINNLTTSTLLSKKLNAYALLMRLDKPIGIYLLLWPTLWALWIAAEGFPPISTLFIFIGGVILMRSAGCIINDFADRKVDGFVERTQHRPIVAGLVQPREALVLFAVLCLIAFCLVLFTNWQTIALSFIALLLAGCYPFMKRYTHFPQVVLGAAFAWSIPMSYTAIQQKLPIETWLIYAAVLTWTVAYDTQYAMVDRDDDKKIGVKSTAIFFGHYDRLAILLLQITSLLCLVAVGLLTQLSVFYYISLCAASAFFYYQHTLIKHRDRHACFRAFLNNHWVGLVVFVGIASNTIIVRLT